MSRMRQYTTQTCSSGPDDRSLTDTGGGYHLGAPNVRLDHSPSFLSSILHFPLIAPPSLILNHSINYSSSQYSIHEPGYKSPKSCEWNLPFDFYPLSIAQLWISNHDRIKMIYKKGIMQSRVSFNSYDIYAQVNNNLRTVIKQNH
jgi:hypothetical protein